MSRGLGGGRRRIYKWKEMDVLLLNVTAVFWF